MKHEIFPSGRIPAIPYTAIYTDFNEVLDYKKIKWFVENSDSSIVLSNPCVLIASSSNMDANTGKATAVKGGVPVAVGREVIIFQTPHNTSFISYLLSTSLYRKKTLALARGTTIKHVYPATFRNYKICVPSYGEQNAIAEALSDADALIESLDKLIAKKRQIKQGATQELLTGKRRLPGFSGEWEVKRLGSVLKFQVGFPFSSIYFNETGQGIRLVKNRDLKSDDQIIYYSGGYGDNFLVKNGDVLIGMDGDFLPCLWSKGVSLLNQRVGRILPLNGLSNLYAFYFLIQPLKDIENVTLSTTVKHLSHGDIEGIEKPLPTLDEQIAIATFLSDMDAELAALESRLAKARQIKQGMMQELLTGRIRLL